MTPAGERLHPFDSLRAIINFPSKTRFRGKDDLTGSVDSPLTIRLRSQVAVSLKIYHILSK